MTRTRWIIVGVLATVIVTALVWKFGVVGLVTGLIGLVTGRWMTKRTHVRQDVVDSLVEDAIELGKKHREEQDRIADQEVADEVQDVDSLANFVNRRTGN